MAKSDPQAGPIYHRTRGLDQGPPDTVGEPVDPAFFAPGTCVAYPPTSGDTGKTVFLDAGHGGLDPNGVGYTSNGAQVSDGSF